MNKYAAEKIASEYYNMGIQLALQNAGLTKTANKGKMLGSGLAGIAAGVGGAKAAPGLMAKYEAMMLERANDAIRAAGPNMSMPGQLQSFASQVQPSGLQGLLDQGGREAIMSAGAKDIGSMISGGMGKVHNAVTDQLAKLYETNPEAAMEMAKKLGLG